MRMWSGRRGSGGGWADLDRETDRRKGSTVDSAPRGDAISCPLVVSVFNVVAAFDDERATVGT
jgi:hypothetical protein